MGVWFSSYFYGHYFAGKIAKLPVTHRDKNILTDTFGSSIEAVTGLTQNIVIEKGAAFEQLYSYVSVYVSFGIIIIFLIPVLALFFAPLMTRLMHLGQ
jgi:POT family proton-dependent oligopeptide transporter